MSSTRILIAAGRSLSSVGDNTTGGNAGVEPRLSLIYTETVEKRRRGLSDFAIWIVSFMHDDLGFIDLEQKTLQPLDNPFGTGLSPMS